jgi:hypothetical protein
MAALYATSASCSTSAASPGGAASQQDIAFWYEFTLRDIDAGSCVVMYGEAISQASRTILAGERVHVHSLISIRARSGSSSIPPAQTQTRGANWT